MGLLVALLAVIYPAFILKLFSMIHKKWKIRLYWLIVPICLVAGIAGPFWYYVAGTSNILISLEAMISHAQKTGFMAFLVIPSVLSGIVCTLYGYIRPLD
ncbi:MAG: hypothetical protein K0R57_4634 [Paenibacillaceae bacterium]|jgi:hypothetical protein|nr:hypothetical protein [Paenibacillaceae bacterium]